MAPPSTQKNPASGTSTPKDKRPREEFAIKPDQDGHKAEQNAFQAEIQIIQTQLDEVKAKINLATNSSSGSAEPSRRNQLKAELDTLKGSQAESKRKRGKILDELKAVREEMNKKIKDMQTAKAKLPFKSIEDVDAHIKSLEKEVESGSLTIANEKRKLAEISSLKRSRRSVESFADVQSSIDSLKVKADGLSAQLDDPASKAASDRFESVRAELAELQKEGDLHYENRNKLFDQKRELMGKLDEVYGKKKEKHAAFKEAQDIYWVKVHEERARKQERAKAERKEADAARRLEQATQLREDAKLSAFQAQIEDCQTLIDYLSGKPTSFRSSQALQEKKAIVGVAALEARKVAVDENLVVRNKKDDDESFFVGGKKKKGGQQKKTKANGLPAPVEKEKDEGAEKDKPDAKLNLPLHVLAAIMELSIPPPTSSSDVPRAIEDLHTKKTWFEVNNDRVTKENVAKAEKEIRRLEGRLAPEDTETNGTKEPFHTPAVPADSAPSTEGISLPTELDEVKEEPEVVAKLDHELEEVAAGDDKKEGEGEQE